MLARPETFLRNGAKCLVCRVCWLYVLAVGIITGRVRCETWVVQAVSKSRLSGKVYDAFVITVGNINDEKPGPVLCLVI